MADLIQNPTSKTSASSHPFLTSSQDVYNMLSDLNTTTQQAINDFFLLSELARFAAALEEYRMRLEISMNCLLNALGHAGIKLQLTAEDFNIMDQGIMNIFNPIQPRYPGFEPGVSGPNPIPGLTLPGLNIYNQYSSTLTPNLTPNIMPNLSGTPNLNGTPNLTPNIMPNLNGTPSLTPNIMPNLNGTPNLLPSHNSSPLPGGTSGLFPQSGSPPLNISPGTFNPPSTVFNPNPVIPGLLPTQTGTFNLGSSNMILGGP